MLKYIYILFFVGLSANCCLAQNSQSALTPIFNFLNISDSQTFINPSGENVAHNVSFKTKYASYIGPKKVIKETYIDAWFRFKTEHKFSFGVQMMNNAQGSFSNLFALKLIPKYSVSMNENTKLSFATGLGIVNYSFESNENIVGGSSMVPDLDLGISLKLKKYTFGLSALHLIDKPLNPIELNYYKHQYLNFQALKITDLSIDYELNTSLFANYDISTKSLYPNIYIEPIYRKQFKGIVALNSLKLVVYGIGFDKMETSFGELGFSFLFSNSISNTNRMNANKYEIGLNYSLN